MRALVQRVSKAEVRVEDSVVGAIGRGLLIFLGIAAHDDEAVTAKLWHKIRHLRIFPDTNGKTNCALDEVGGQVLLVSQFTLYADVRRGHRPSFTAAADAAHGEALYTYMATLIARDLGAVACGRFGAKMAVDLINDGPFTIWLDSAMWEDCPCRS